MTPASSTYSTYRRLFWTFARPYLWRLAIGISAGLVIGGAVAGVTVLTPDIFRILVGQAAPARLGEEAPARLGEEAPARLGEEAPAKGRLVERLIGQFDEADGAAGVQAPAAAGETATATPLPSSELNLIVKLAERFGIPIEVNGAVSLQMVVLIVCALFGFFLAQAVAEYVNRYMLRWVGARVVTDIRNRLFRHLLDQSLAFYGKQDVGKLISRCTYDIATVEHAISGTFADIIQSPVQVVGSLCAIVYVTWNHDLLGLLFILLLAFPLFILPTSYLARILKRYAERALNGISILVSRMQETFSGIRVVKAFNMEEHESARFAHENENYFRVVIRALGAEILMAPLMQLVSVGITCVFVVLCYVKHVELAILVAVAYGATRAYKPIKLLAKINVQIQRCAAAADRIFELFDTDTRLPESPHPVVLKEIADRIVFERVGFFYEEGGLRILQDIDFEIPRGSVIAFVGETGSGKSTIANLVARFYDPSEGRVTLDGHDLRDVDMASLRRLIGVVTQETILFNDTIGNNIRYGRPDATMEEVIEAAKQANAHGFIMKEREGYDKVVGEKGCKVSGGERQRLAIARAILKNPPILILDEATSALDTATEQLVQEAINHVMADRTVFAIAHRLSTIKHANQILVLDKGRVIERGTHDELLARDGRYRKLCEMQFS
ncbi:MAG: ABC transporter ATP-binding protein [Lentisphaeria bacterium]|jgi:subfamily B ATP-binding cassette protein MsbA|nr:ABC transporter ATP-binding protein [Lentisphaeria bacterium]